MSRVDVFVLFDSVQFSRRSWQQRNQIKTANGPKFLTVPVKKSGRRDQIIAETEINSEENALEKHVRMIQSELKGAPFYEQYSAELFKIMLAPVTKLADLNIGLILYLKDCLGIETAIVRSSTLETMGTKADLLADICNQLGADEYVSPPGSKDYMDASDAFSQKNIVVSYLHYEHPTYRQRHGAFVPYMSIIDLLFNEGPDSRSIMIDGIQNP